MICHTQVCFNDAEPTSFDGKVRLYDKLFHAANTEMVNNLQAPVQRIQDLLLRRLQVCYVFLSRHLLFVSALLNSVFMHLFTFAPLKCNSNHGILKQRLL